MYMSHTSLIGKKDSVNMYIEYKCHFQVNCNVYAPVLIYQRHTVFARWTVMFMPPY